MVPLRQPRNRTTGPVAWTQTMTVRTTRKTVTFRSAFRLGGFDLGGFDELLPAGAYVVETDEEPVAGISVPAYRRKMTVIHLHTRPGHLGQTRLLTVDPRELDAALERDRALAEIAVGGEAAHESLQGKRESRRHEADRQAIDRAESEGMVGQRG